jgi:RNA 2',3'-cyclic 3'-phosphodiesterase
MTADAAPASRLFFAVYPDAGTAAAIFALGEAIRARHGLRGPGVRPDRLHATVAYLGTFDTLPLPLVAAAKVAADRIAPVPVPVEFDTVASFDSRRGVYPLVLRGCDNGPLRLLHRDLVAALDATRAIAGGDPFEPHVTLMRSRRLLPAEAVAPVRWIARELVLVHSLVGQGRYEWLHRRPLAAPGAGPPAAMGGADRFG